MSRLRLTPRAYRTITVLALVALATIVITGAAVRLTGSGLGCTDWPECEEGQFFAELDSPNAMAEFTNRLFTGVVSIAVILAVLGSLARRPRRRDLTWLSVGLVVGVIAQIVWGGVTVWSELAPQMVMGHFLISSALLADAVVLVVRAGSGGAPTGWAVGRDPSGPPEDPTRAPTAARLSRVLVAVGTLVLVTGTVVTNTGPHAGDEDARRFGFEIVTVARIHSASVWALLVLTLATLWVAYRSGAPERVRRRGALLVAAILAQGAVGYVQYATGVPAWLVGVHVLGSVLVWLAVLGLHLSMAERPPLEDPDGGDEAAEGGTGPWAVPDDEAVTAPGPVVGSR